MNWVLVTTARQYLSSNPVEVPTSVQSVKLRHQLIPEIRPFDIYRGCVCGTHEGLSEVIHTVVEMNGIDLWAVAVVTRIREPW